MDWAWLVNRQQGANAGPSFARDMTVPESAVLTRRVSEGSRRPSLTRRVSALKSCTLIQFPATFTGLVEIFSFRIFSKTVW
jgi:hypothetical protein